MPFRAPGLLLGGLLTSALLIPAAALAGPTVSVRVEGTGATLVSKQVTLPDAPSATNSRQCGTASAWSAFEALDAATGGDWSRVAFFDTILGEKHDFTDSDYWAVWVGRAGGYVFGNGACDQIMQSGDELLVIVDVSPPPSYASTVFPLKLRAPAIVEPGKPFTVNVDRYVPDNGTPGTGIAEPAAGVTIATGAGEKADTNAAGTARLSLITPGEFALSAATAGTRALPLKVCATNGADGHCGTKVPPADAPAAQAAAGQTVLPATVAVRDVAAPLARIAGIREQQRFARGKGPRELSGTVEADASGIRELRLRLTRRTQVSAPGRVRVRGKVRSRLRTRCTRFDFVSERWKTMDRCGASRAPLAAIGSQASWSYLLPSRLPAGRYVLDIQAVDGAGNVTRGDRRGKPGDNRNRVVFHVR